MRVTRRDLLVGTAALPFALRASAQAESFPLSFLVLGDWGREGEYRQRDVAKQMGLAGARRHCRFVVSLGDNFYETGVESTEDDDWRTSYEQVYTAPSLQVPWYAILGNHDYHGNVQAQIDYSKKSPRWRMPALYYQILVKTADGAAVEMFFLDSNDIHKHYELHDEGENEDDNRRERAESWAAVPQLGWLESKLAASTAEWKLVFGHHPIASGGEHGPTPELVVAVKPLLERYGVAAYFCGHDHDMQHIVDGRLHYFVCGAGSSTRTVGPTKGTQFFSDREGFAAVAIAGRNLSIDFVDFTGAVLHSAQMDRPV